MEKQNAEKFRELCKRGRITQAHAAELITEQIIMKVDARRVRRWLAKPDCKSHVPCPDWAVIALEIQLKKSRKIT